VQRKELPLPSLRNVPGAPKYLINEFRLLDCDEGLRDTLLYKLVGGALVFDNIAAMEQYRECVPRTWVSLDVFD